MADLKDKLAFVQAGTSCLAAEATPLGIARALTEAGARVVERLEDAPGMLDITVEWRAPQVWRLQCATPQGPAALTLLTDAQDPPLFIGRCVAALAMDPDLPAKSGGSYRIPELAGEYRFTNPEDVRT